MELLSHDWDLIAALTALPDKPLRKLIALTTEEDGNCKFIPAWSSQSDLWRDNSRFAQGKKAGCLIGKSMSAKAYEKAAQENVDLARLAEDVFPNWCFCEFERLDISDDKHELWRTKLPKQAVNRLAQILEHEAWNRWPNEFNFTFKATSKRLRKLEEVPV